MNILLNIFEQSFLLLPLVLGVYISYRILKITDLTVDGTYVLGAAIFARSIHLGVIVAIFLAIIAGCFVGIIVSIMQKRDRVSDLIVGILASFMLYSVNLQVMGKPNISVLNMSNLLSVTNFVSWLAPLTIIALILLLITLIVLNSKLGLTLRSFGYNRKLLYVLGKNPEKYRLIGLMCSNGLAAFAGSLAAQVNGFADINMGFGVALVGIGAVVVGSQIVIGGRNEGFFVYKETISCLVGIFLYFLSLNVLLQIGINPINLKFILGSVLFLTIRNINRKNYQ